MVRKYTHNPIIPLWKVGAKPEKYKKGTKTKIARGTRHVTVRYHNTDIITIDSVNRVVTLNSGGWWTATTKRRMNQIMQDFGIPYLVEQYKFRWHVYNLLTGKAVDYYDGIELSF